MLHTVGRVNCYLRLIDSNDYDVNVKECVDGHAQLYRPCHPSHRPLCRPYYMFREQAPETKIALIIRSLTPISLEYDTPLSSRLSKILRLPVQY